MSTRFGEKPDSITEVEVSAYKVPTDAPESDGTFAWDKTTLVLVEGRWHTGAGLTAVNVRNTDFQASVTNITGTLPASVTDLTVSFDNASAVLPAITINNLTVTALGIVQQSGTALVISGTAMAETIPIKATVRSSSTSVKPVSVRVRSCIVAVT